MRRVPFLNASHCLVVLCCVGFATAALGQRVTPQVVLTASGSTVSPGTVVNLLATVSDSNGPVTAGEVDLLDGGKNVGTTQIVRSAAAGYTPGTANFKKLLAPGTHTLQAVLHQTNADSGARSNSISVVVSGASQSSSATPFYTQTVAFSGPVGAFAVADVNGDGIPDIVASIAQSSGAGNLSVSLGDPAHPGQFLAPTSVAVGEIFSMEVVDFNGDGLPDLVLTVNRGDGKGALVGLYANSPSQPGSFAFASEIDEFPDSVLVADLDGDGVPDLGLTLTSTLDNSSSFAIYKGSGGGFVSESTLSLPSSFAGLLFAADVNGDGLTDLVAQQSSSTGRQAAILLQNADTPGTFTLTANPVDLPGQLVALGDVNGDGAADLLLSGEQALQVITANPSQPGSFNPAATYAVPSQVLTGLLGPMAVGDVNGDGYPDVVSGTGTIDTGIGPGTNALLLFYGQPDGTLSAAQPLTTAPGPQTDAWASQALVLADMDGDGVLDVVNQGGGQPTVQVYAHQTAGTPLVRTATVLSTSPAVLQTGQTLSLVATIDATSGTPQGRVSFYLSSYAHGGPSTLIGTGTLVSGVASLPIAPPYDTGTYTAAYAGGSGFAPSVSDALNADQPGNGAPGIKLQLSSTTVSGGSPLQMMAEVYTANPPTGSVLFIDGYSPDTPGNKYTVLGTVPVAKNGTASFSITTLSPGQHEIAAAYEENGTVLFYSGYPTQVTVVGLTPTVNVTFLPAAPVSSQPLQIITKVSGPAGQPIPTGSVSYNAFPGSAPQTLDASGTASFTTSLNAGSFTISVIYGGDATYNAITTPVTFTVGQDLETVSLTATPSEVVSGRTITFNVNVAPENGGTLPAGAVALLENGTTLASGTLDGSGNFSAPLSTLAVGAHNITAQYTGTNNNVLYQSNAVSVQVFSSDFPLSASPSSITIHRGLSGTVTITAPSVSGLSDTLTFACGTLPAHTICRFSPSTLSYPAQQSVQLTIDTDDATTATLREPQHGGPTSAVVTCLTPLGLLSLAGLSSARRRRRVGRYHGWVLFVFATAMTCAGLTSCAANPPYASPGNYQIVVTGTATNTGLVGSTTISLTVTQ